MSRRLPYGPLLAIVLAGCAGGGGDPDPLVDVGTLRFSSPGSAYAGETADVHEARGYGGSDERGFEFWVTPPDEYGNYGTGRLIRVSLPRASFGPFDLASSREASVAYVEGQATESPTEYVATSGTLAVRRYRRTAEGDVEITVQLRNVRVRRGTSEADAVTIDGAVVLSTAPAPV